MVETITQTDMDAVIKAARKQVEVILADGREWAVMPRDFELRPLTEHVAPPPYTIARRTFHDGNSLAAYVNQFKGDAAQLFADIDSSEIVVSLDHDGPDAPSVRKHTVVLPIRLGEAFSEWDEIEGKMHPQEEFLRFLEENASDCIDPEPATLIELVKDFSASKAVSFRGAHRLDNGDRQIAYTTETNVAGHIVVPQQLTFRMPIYYGEAEYDLVAKFRYRLGEKLHLGVEWHRIEPVKRAAFKLAATRIAEACGLTPLFGRPA